MGLRLSSRFHSNFVQIGAAVTFVWIFVYCLFRYQSLPDSWTWANESSQQQHQQHASPSTSSSTPRPIASIAQTSDSIIESAQYFLDYPLTPPYKDIFGELGVRARLLRTWVEQLEATKHTPHTDEERLLREFAANYTLDAAQSLFPYLQSSSSIPHNFSPLIDLRNRVSAQDDEAITAPPPSKRTAGIVIPTGLGTLRFACHLIASLTRVHGTRLPIQIVYAGDKDLPAEGREKIQKAAADDVKIEFLDALTVFDDRTLRLVEGGWAIKPFAALASDFEQVILLDADVVFLQDPERLLEQERYKETGVLLFHDRLLWKNGFKDRQDWWHQQIKHPSAETAKSLVWTERYSEEGDSGIVVVDKSRLEVLIGLLHVGWQNSFLVREEWTYKATYGDKETWWIGFEATGSKYAFSKHYGGMIGWLEPEPKPEEKVEEKSEEKPEVKESEEDPAEISTDEMPEEQPEHNLEDELEEKYEEQYEEKPEEELEETTLGENSAEISQRSTDEQEQSRVCSFVIAHVDESDKLLWYNGGLLKNKLADPNEFEVPTHWMMDQEWHKGGKKEMSCMVGTHVNEVSNEEKNILAKNIEVAKEVDSALDLLPKVL